MTNPACEARVEFHNDHRTKDAVYRAVCKRCGIDQELRISRFDRIEDCALRLDGFECQMATALPAPVDG